MIYKDFQFPAYGQLIKGQYTPYDDARGVVVLVHGFGEHSGRYKEKVIPALTAIGLAVVIYDNIGHGRSGGKRGHCPSYEALISIMDKVLVVAESQFPDRPVLFYGHSMGGNLVLNYGIRNPLAAKAIVATSPYLRLAFKPPAWKMKLGKILLNVMPSLTMASGLDPKGISTIDEEVLKYKRDPLVHDKVSPMYSLPVMHKGEEAILNAAELKIPTLLLHGSADPIIDCKGTEEFHRNASTTTFATFEKAYHELHNDFCADALLKSIQNWLQQQL